MHMGVFMNFLEIHNTLHCVFSRRLDGSVCSTIEQDLIRRVSRFKEGREDIRLNFDLGEVVYISSAFLRVCLICYRTVGENVFSVTNASEEIHKVFHVSGFSKMMNVTRAQQTLEGA